ncbi:MAG: hypothetical protein LAQ69_19910 [Acidobacteriia bacterium]|nr:hypothetical protein [Terriglobia bacterium]
MIPFMEKFPELGAAETRSVTVTVKGRLVDLPDGEYGFLELYCNEPGCDCRRVTIDVLRPETGWRKIWATISYGWASLDFYRKWGPSQDPREMQGPSLDTLNAQSPYSSALLDLFRSLLQSPEYVERLKRHYQMFRATIDQTGGSSARHEIHRLRNRSAKLRDPKRRSRRPH